MLENCEFCNASMEACDVPLYSSYVPQLKISNSVNQGSNSVPFKACTAGSWSNSVNIYAPRSEMAPLISSATKRGEAFLLDVIW
jgi:hypothetical protein